jgi:hypothetical protein
MNFKTRLTTSRVRLSIAALLSAMTFGGTLALAAAPASATSTGTISAQSVAPTESSAGYFSVSGAGFASGQNEVIELQWDGSVLESYSVTTSDTIHGSRDVGGIITPVTVPGGTFTIQLSGICYGSFNVTAYTPVDVLGHEVLMANSNTVTVTGVGCPE